jgi:lysophospholipase L1-like esterase
MSRRLQDIRNSIIAKPLNATISLSSRIKSGMSRSFGNSVAAQPDAAAIVALGDSITDGHDATTNGNDRWTDVLAKRLRADPRTRSIGVLNQGIGGNHLLTDGLGPNALARFDHDVLAQTGIRWVIVLEGVNDIGGFTRLGNPPLGEHKIFVQRVLASNEQIIARAHAAHLLGHWCHNPSLHRFGLLSSAREQRS